MLNKRMPITVMQNKDFSAFLMQLIPMRTSTAHEKEQNHVLGHMGDLLKESPKLQVQVCCSYPPDILSYLQPKAKTKKKKRNRKKKNTC